MKGRPLAYSPEQVERIRELALTLTDPKIGEQLGLLKWKVLHIRTREGIPPYRGSVWPDERLARLHQLYIVEGLPSPEVGRLIGCSDKTVRSLAHKRGWERDVALRATNISKAQRAIVRPPRPPRVRKPRPRVERPASHIRRVSAPRAGVDTSKDADLIAAFLASKPVTVLEPGMAAGLSSWEMALGTARPPNSSIHEQAARFHDKKKVA